MLNCVLFLCIETKDDSMYFLGRVYVLFLFNNLAHNVGHPLFGMSSYLIEQPPTEQDTVFRLRQHTLFDAISLS